MTQTDDSESSPLSKPARISLAFFASLFLFLTAIVLFSDTGGLTGNEILGIGILSIIPSAIVYGLYFVWLVVRKRRGKSSTQESNSSQQTDGDLNSDSTTQADAKTAGSKEATPSNGPSTTTLEEPKESIRAKGQTTATSQSMIPQELPSAPQLSLSYDKIENTHKIGSGGSADVYRATAQMESGDVELAIKEPRISGETINIETPGQILAEADTWEQLDDHKHIVSVVDYGSNPLSWIGMEYMDGGHLGLRSGQMTYPQALWTAIAVTKAVRHAHRKGVAHLDLKPANILFRTVEDQCDVPKVADWGLSKQLLDHSNSVEELSPQYAAPEQVSDEYGSTDDITDIYQLGAVFYELFTGYPPFDGDPFKVIGKIKEESPTPPSEIADVPEELDDILLTALAKQKGNRYEDILYLRDDLQDLFHSVTASNDIPTESKTEALPVREEVHEDLVAVAETAPNRAWIDEYFDWVATLLESTDLDSQNDCLVTSIRTDEHSLPVTVSWRYCLKGFPNEKKIAAILPADSPAIEELESEATYKEQFNGQSGSEPYYYQLPASAGNFFVEEYQDDWLRAVQEQCDKDRGAKNPDAHEPAVCIAALDMTYRRKILDEAF